jgi:hypothetical protein
MIEAMWPPVHINDVQNLMGCLAALSQFISRLTERALPFFKFLHKSGPFIWTCEAEEAFQELKQYLTSPPVIVALEPGEPLLFYVTAIVEAVSMVLIAERSEPPQPQETKEASTNGSRAQDPEPAGRPGVMVAAGPSSRRCPQLLNPKAEPIAPLCPRTRGIFESREPQALRVRAHGGR